MIDADAIWWGSCFRAASVLTAYWIVELAKRRTVIVEQVERYRHQSCPVTGEVILYCNCVRCSKKRSVLR